MRIIIDGMGGDNAPAEIVKGTVAAAEKTIHKLVLVGDSEKLEKELKAGSYDRYANVMKASVKEALESFADQDDEFAQAIVQGGSFSDCMKAVAKGCGQSISDLEAYQRAAAFYFPGQR